MGNRAVYCLVEDGSQAYFYAHYGANALSPFLRLSQALKAQKELPEKQTVAEVLGNLDYNGVYQGKRLDNADMFFQNIEPEEAGEYRKNYYSSGILEMWVTLDLDQNCCTLEYNPNCPCYCTMGTYSVDLDTGLKNVRRLLEYGREQGITDFYKLLAIYQNSMGLGERLEDSRGSMRLQALLKSPWAAETQQNYQAMLQRQESAEEGQEEMEER